MAIPPMNILLLGANGQLGHQLGTELLALGPVKALTRAQADMSDPVHLRKALENASALFVPGVVVNAAAYTAVDKAETDTAQAMAVNAQSVGVLAEFTQSVGACLVHYSTDYVFDGSGTRPWAEVDAVAPKSVYGQTKYLGEQAIAKTCQKHLVLRTSWVVGSHGGNFLKTMLRLASERDSLRVVADQVGVPTSTQLLANTTMTLLRAIHGANVDDMRWGVYHLAPAGETSWHGYAQHVVAGALARGAKLKARVNDVHPISTAEYPLPAARPLNSRLSTEKIQRTFGLSLPDWQQGVDAILDELIH
jgi:dTDP-4-dehydrorhamnose reductase